MPRYHGKRGQLYMSTSAGAAASPVAQLSSWTLDMETEKVDVTCFLDANRVYVQGFKNIQGTIGGIWNSADDTLYDASDSADGANFYLYPSIDAIGKYFYGVAWVSASLDTSATGAVTVSGSFAAAGTWGRQ